MGSAHCSQAQFSRSQFLYAGFGATATPNPFGAASTPAFGQQQQARFGLRASETALLGSGQAFKLSTSLHAGLSLWCSCSSFWSNPSCETEMFRSGLLTCPIAPCAHAFVCMHSQPTFGAAPTQAFGAPAASPFGASAFGVS